MVAMMMLEATETRLMMMLRVEANVSVTFWEREGEVRLITMELCHIWTRP